MRSRLTRIALAAALAAAMPAVALASEPGGRGENCLGVRAGYTTRNSTAVAGIVYQYRFSRHFRLSPNIDYIVRRHSSDALGMNLNCHFPLQLGAEAGRANFYPLTGVSLTSWSIHNAGPEDVTDRVTRMGLNFGAGVECYCSSTLKLSVEAKFNLVKGYSAGVFTAGISYVF